MSIPTPIESEISATLETVRDTGIAHCRLCDEPLDVRDADGWGDVLDALAEHGEAEHEWVDGKGWAE